MNDKIRLTNRLRYALKQYYPQVLEWFEDIDTLLFCDYIARWPTLIQAKRARANTLKRFFREHNMRFAHVLERRVTAIKQAQPLTMDEGVIIPHRLQSLVLIDQLRIMLGAIKQFDEAIEALASKHVDYRLFRPLPGAGPKRLTILGQGRGIDRVNHKEIIFLKGRDNRSFRQFHGHRNGASKPLVQRLRPFINLLHLVWDRTELSLFTLRRLEADIMLLVRPIKTDKGYIVYFV